MVCSFMAVPPFMAGPRPGGFGHPKGCHRLFPISTLSDYTSQFLRLWFCGRSSLGGFQYSYQCFQSRTMPFDGNGELKYKLRRIAVSSSSLHGGGGSLALVRSLRHGFLS